MKHIKVKATFRPSTNDVRLEWLGQTHYAENFGNSLPFGTTEVEWGAYGLCAFSIGSYCIVSHPWDEFRTGVVDFQFGNWLLVPCSSHTSSYGTVVSLKEWEWIKKVILVYNEWGDSQ